MGDIDGFSCFMGMVSTVFGGFILWLVILSSAGDWSCAIKDPHGACVVWQNQRNDAVRLTNGKLSITIDSNLEVTR